MVRVVVPALRDATPAENACYCDERCVEDGDGENDDGHERSNHRLTCALYAEGHYRQHVAQEKAPAVTHEDAGRLGVVGEEAETSAGKGCRHCGEPNLPHCTADENERGGRHRGDAGGKSIQAVDEIDGVRDADNPEKSERDGDPKRAAPPERVAGVEEEGRGQHLNHQFCFGTNVP
jgi:hypothetical protein